MLRRKTLHGTREKREYVDNWTDFLWESKINELFTKNNVLIMSM